MAKYLDNDGLLYLWQKIKTTFAKTSDVPTKTSDIVNDSGFITSADVPEGASASTSTPLMDGTAAVGTSTAFARGDHRHPSDKNKVDKVDGKGLSTNDYTTAEKNKLSSIVLSHSGGVTYVLTVGDNSVNVPDVDILLETTIPTSYYNKTEVNGMMGNALTTVQGMIDSAVTNMYKYKGSVATVSALPSSGNTAGDVYNVESSGMNYAWNGDAWDALGEIFTITSISNSDIDTIVAS